MFIGVAALWIAVSVDQMQYLTFYAAEVRQNNYNPSDPNLQLDRYKEKQCQFSHSPFCNAEGDTNAEELSRQRKEEKTLIDQQKRRYQLEQERKNQERAKDAQLSFERCMSTCDSWFRAPNVKMNAKCKDDCGGGK